MTADRYRRRRPRRPAKPILSLLAFLVTFTFFSTFFFSSYFSSSARTRSRLAKAAFNETLGFGDIIYISMPSRTDRQDAMTLLASWSGLILHHFPGVDGASIERKARPDHTPDDMPLSALGCWRAHANVWRHFLSTNLETVLVLEDDLDWDVNIHEIFELFSLYMQSNTLRTTPPPHHETESAPYGLDWDILNLGQCYNQPNADRLDLFATYKDPYLPSSLDSVFVDMRMMMQQFKLSPEDMQTNRVVSPSWQPTCTMAYALTRSGAQRMLFHSSYAGLHEPVDLEIISHAQSGKIKGYDLTPPPFNAWRTDGQKDSDNNALNSRRAQSLHGKGNLGGYSLNIGTSVRREIALEMARFDNWHDLSTAHPVSDSR
ncbi:LPS glycosyltransferase [Myxozyma melibiosi]|uniref:LPS glycosyltransferase n=1 Tax=Myxozyma melibiosi TaxID=54550 RepID=A0ABR1EZ68_9ASCO